MQIPACDFSGPPYIGGIIPETHSLPQCADRLGRDDRRDTSASHTQASLPNNSYSVRQIAQYTRAKKTGVASKLLRSVTMPVGIWCPVSGHLTMAAPIELSLFRIFYSDIRHNSVNII